MEDVRARRRRRDGVDGMRGSERVRCNARALLDLVRRGELSGVPKSGASSGAMLLRRDDMTEMSEKEGERDGSRRRVRRRVGVCGARDSAARPVTSWRQWFR